MNLKRYITLFTIALVVVLGLLAFQFNQLRNDEAKDGPIADEVDEMLEIQRKEANQEKWRLSQI